MSTLSVTGANVAFFACPPPPPTAPTRQPDRVSVLINLYFFSPDSKKQEEEGATFAVRL
jgi:hypothetical protein